MKKLIMTVAVLACATSMVSAQVTSANIVGYAKKTIGDGAFVIASPQFQGTGAGTTLDNAFSGLNNGSSVFAFNGSGYVQYDYYAGYGWYQGVNPAGSTVISAGDAVWLKDGGGGAETIMSGEVPSAASITNTLQVGFNLVANPYPVALKLSDIPTASLSNGDSAFVFTGSGYVQYDYYAGYGWYQGVNPAGSTTIPVGSGFWLSTAAGGDLVFSKSF
jgi:hypothetical protein